MSHSLNYCEGFRIGEVQPFQKMCSCNGSVVATRVLVALCIVILLVAVYYVFSMKPQTPISTGAGLVILVILLFALQRALQLSTTHRTTENYGFNGLSPDLLVRQIQESSSSGSLPQVSEAELEALEEKIAFVAEKPAEGYSRSYHHYRSPVYDRLLNRSPSFYTTGSGWKVYQMPQRVAIPDYPFGQWVRNNGDYYFINNDSTRTLAY